MRMGKTWEGFESYTDWGIFYLKLWSQMPLQKWFPKSLGLRRSVSWKIKVSWFLKRLIYASLEISWIKCHPVIDADLHIFSMSVCICSFAVNLTYIHMSTNFTDWSVWLKCSLLTFFRKKKKTWGICFYSTLFLSIVLGCGFACSICVCLPQSTECKCNVERHMLLVVLCCV